MSHHERGYQPLPYVENTPDSQIIFNLHLPDYAGQTQIGVNRPRISRLMRHGGIHSLTVMGTSGDVTKYTPGVVEVTPDGNALAGGAGISELKSTYLTSSRTNNSLFALTRWSDLTLTVNLDEVQNRLSDKKALRSPNAWSKELDVAVRKGLLHEGFQNLIFDATNFNMFSATAIPVAVFSASQIVDNSSVTRIIASNLVGYAISNAIEALFAKNIDRIRPSFISGVQLDRAAILYTLGTSGRVIKEIPAAK